MKTIHVGGLKMFNKVNTMAEALAKAKDDDTISIHKPINECVTISKSIIINGNGNKWVVPENGTAITTTTDVVIDNIIFSVGSRSNAIALQKDSKLSKIIIKLNGPIREFYPIILFSSGHHTVSDSKLILAASSDSTNIEFNNTEFKSYYPTNVILSTRADMSSISGISKFNNCKLKSIVIRGKSEITNSELQKYVDLEGEVTLSNINLNPELVNEKKNQYKKEPKNGPLEDRIEDKYIVAFRDSNIILNGYTVNSEIDTSFAGIFSVQSSLTVNDVTNSDSILTHHIFNSTVSFKDTHDNNYWNFDKSKIAYVRSNVEGNNHQVTAKEKLDNMVGLTSVKNQINTILNTIAVNQNSNDKDFEFSYNMIFAGDPGTGKSTVAELVTETLFEIGAIKENKFTMATSDEFVKGYVGQTGENTRKILDKALGGVLFIDEAYELTVKENGNSFNSEVISVLIRYMEQYRSDLIVIAAGYSKEMKDFLASNPGFARRFQWINFEDYTGLEMAQIFEKMRTSYNDQYEDPIAISQLETLFNNIIKYNLSRPDSKGRYTNGGNGGLVRNIYQRVVQLKNNRIVQGGTPNITKEDLRTAVTQEIEKTKMIKA